MEDISKPHMSFIVDTKYDQDKSLTDDMNKN